MSSKPFWPRRSLSASPLLLVGLRARGWPPQIVIGLAVTREGIPVRVWCWPGNTNDQTILPEVRDGLRGWRLGRVVTVVGRGFSSDANLAYLQRGRRPLDRRGTHAGRLG